MYNSLTPHSSTIPHEYWIHKFWFSFLIQIRRRRRQTVRTKIICYRPIQRNKNHSMNWFSCFIWIGSRLHIDWRPFESFYHLYRNKRPPIRPFMYSMCVPKWNGYYNESKFTFTKMKMTPFVFVQKLWVSFLFFRRQCISNGIPSLLRLETRSTLTEI